jgi:hypothetical protein
MKNPTANLAIHIFSVSAAMVGVCLTAIGLFRIVDGLREFQSLADDLLATNAVLFRSACGLAYYALRTADERRRQRAETIADIVFLIAMVLLTATCGILVYELA